MGTIIVAPDSFKGSLSAHEAAAAMELGVHDADPNVHVIILPLSDGGEGLVEVLTGALRGTIQEMDVQGPLPRQRVRARWGWIEYTQTAVIEMAEAAGLGLVPPERRDPKITTTYGVGEIMRAALDRGATSLVVGIGGSATNDGGAGMAEALGVSFFGDDGEPLPRGGAALARLHRCELTGRDPRIARTKILVACDVRNPLVGREGASAVFGPQKGATPEDVSILDAALVQFRRVILTQMGIDVQLHPGSGAAGGLGAGLVAFCDAELRLGISIVLDALRFDDLLESADLVITGEGKMDAQTKHGKVVAGVLDRCRQKSVPVAAVVGILEVAREEVVGPHGLVDVISLVTPSVTAEYAIRNARELIRERTGTLTTDFLSITRNS